MITKLYLCDSYRLNMNDVLSELFPYTHDEKYDPHQQKYR